MDTVATARRMAVKVVKCSEEPKENLLISWTKLATHTTLVTGVSKWNSARKSATTVPLTI